MRPARKIFFLFLLFILSACQSSLPSDLLTQTPAPAFTLPVPPTAAPTATAPPTGTSAPTLTVTPALGARRVLILSIDGLRPDIISLAPMPNLLDLMQNSAYSLSAQTILPSATLPSHASMLGGYCPDIHGVHWNDYIPENGVAIGTDLFDISQAAGLQTVMYAGKEKLQQVTEPSSLDQFVFINDRDLVIAEQLIQNFPADFGLLFVHFPIVDGMGHQYGWLSPEQLSVAFRADEALKMILDELEARGLRKETLVIVTADHGGHDTSHGSSRPEDMTIPWIASGPGIRPGQLTTTVHTMDTAATAAFALGLQPPDDWDGVPVYEAFGLPVEEASTQCE